MSRIPWVAQSIILVALIGLVLFGAAGRLDVPAFWAYLALWLAASLVSVAVVSLQSLVENAVKARLNVVRRDGHSVVEMVLPLV